MTGARVVLLSLFFYHFCKADVNRSYFKAEPCAGSEVSRTTRRVPGAFGVQLAAALAPGRWGVYTQAQSRVASDSHELQVHGVADHVRLSSCAYAPIAGNRAQR